MVQRLARGEVPEEQRDQVAAAMLTAQGPLPIGNAALGHLLNRREQHVHGGAEGAAQATASSPAPATSIQRKPRDRHGKIYSGQDKLPDDWYAAYADQPTNVYHTYGDQAAGVSPLGDGPVPPWSDPVSEDENKVKRKGAVRRRRGKSKRDRDPSAAAPAPALDTAVGPAASAASAAPAVDSGDKRDTMYDMAASGAVNWGLGGDDFFQGGSSWHDPGGAAPAPDTASAATAKAPDRRYTLRNPADIAAALAGMSFDDGQPFVSATEREEQNALIEEENYLNIRFAEKDGDNHRVAEWMRQVPHGQGPDDPEGFTGL